MDRKDKDTIVQKYQEKIRGKYTKNAVDTRKKFLRKALDYFVNEKDFVESINNNSRLSAKLLEIQKDYPFDMAGIKNAISIYAKEFLGLSIFSKEKDIVEALNTYGQAVSNFDKFGEFDTVNIIGEYGEYYACTHYGLQRAFTNTKLYDATFEENGAIKRVQIKTRWYRGHNVVEENIEFGKINLSIDQETGEGLDYFVGLVFDNFFKLIKAIVMDRSMIDDYFVEHSREKKAVIYNGKNFDTNKYSLKVFNGYKIKC